MRQITWNKDCIFVTIGNDYADEPRARQSLEEFHIRNLDVKLGSHFEVSSNHFGDGNGFYALITSLLNNILDLSQNSQRNISTKRKQ